MALNCNEIKLLVSELPLQDSVLQAITEHDFHSFTLSLFHKVEKAWFLYVELGSQESYLCRTDRIIKAKAKKLQRFGQYFRANVIGSRITEVKVIDGERFFSLKLTHNELTSYIHFRFYSGAGANVLLTDENLKITEAMMRRPQRGDSAGNLLALPEPNEASGLKFKVREYNDESFNRAIDNYYRTFRQTEGLEEKLALLKEQENKSLQALLTTKANLEKRIESTQYYNDYKESADLLSCYSYQIEKNATFIALSDFSGNQVTIPLDEKLTASENIQQYYLKAQKTKKTFESSQLELAEVIKEIESEKAKYNKVYQLTDSKEQLKQVEQLLKQQKETKVQTEAVLGLRTSSNGFDIIVGRSAKENDQILRTLTRGSDLWLHTRDYAGGYVIIKSKKDKTIPLEVLLDAGNLAVHFSKAKENGKADLYYTQCKYLRRAKDSKLGLVLPTQEKNLTIILDDKRIKRLLL